MLNGPDGRQIRVASIRDAGLLDVTDNGGGVVRVIDALPFARSPQGDKRNGNGAKRRSSHRALLSLSPSLVVLSRSFLLLSWQSPRSS